MRSVTDRSCQRKVVAVAQIFRPVDKIPFIVYICNKTVAAFVFFKIARKSRNDGIQLL